MAPKASCHPERSEGSAPLRHGAKGVMSSPGSSPRAGSERSEGSSHSTKASCHPPNQVRGHALSAAKVLLHNAKATSRDRDWVLQSNFIAWRSVIASAAPVASQTPEPAPAKAGDGPVQTIPSKKKACTARIFRLAMRARQGQTSSWSIPLCRCGSPCLPACRWT